MFTVGCQRGQAYVLAVASGPGNVEEVCSGALFIAEMLRRTGGKRVLVDMTSMDPHLVQADALEVISTLYACLPPLEKIAVLMAPGASHGIILEVARHRDVPAREFANITEADAWLQL
jgi:hypothetical protein